MNVRLPCAAVSLVLSLLGDSIAPIVAQAQTAADPPASAAQVEPLEGHPAAHASPQAASNPVHDGAPTAIPQAATPPKAAIPAVATDWPSPVADDARYSMVLLDLVEYQRVGGAGAGRWDMVGWWGGDRRRFWLKSEGTLSVERKGGSQLDAQALYGKLLSPFFDLQLGLRVEQRREVDANPTRAFTVIGVQGLAPYRIELEPALFLSNKGKFSGRLTASYNTLITQRLIVQSRFETEMAAQRDAEFGVESGVNDAELGLRLRYEVRREFAPYLGISYRRSFGATRDRVLREGGNPNELQAVVGLRTWF